MDTQKKSFCHGKVIPLHGPTSFQYKTSILIYSHLLFIFMLLNPQSAGVSQSRIKNIKVDHISQRDTTVILCFLGSVIAFSPGSLRICPHVPPNQSGGKENKQIFYKFITTDLLDPLRSGVWKVPGQERKHWHGFTAIKTISLGREN